MCSGSCSVGSRTTPSGNSPSSIIPPQSESPRNAGSRSRQSLKASADAAASRADTFARASGHALEIERAGVDAVAQARRLRPVLEHVTEMAAARGAHHLGARHPVARVRLGDHAVQRRRLVEARPAASRLELRVGAEELGAAARTAVHAVGVLVPIRAGERALRAFVAQDLVLLGRESLAPLLLGELCLRFHGSRVPRPGQSTTSESATNWVTAAAMTSTWKISWKPNVAGNGLGQALA